ncbi:hypothetical protein [Mongoliimonas terrestris]|uniref:hypothetical protein n=1 Tax=Mongoliimonas terrestris TaxID=1709001 RepID=UPI000949AF31|nr:hypothetical protein [Mongoliimonas terrestris]
MTEDTTHVEARVAEIMAAYDAFAEEAYTLKPGEEHGKLIPVTTDDEGAPLVSLYAVALRRRTGDLLMQGYRVAHYGDRSPLITRIADTTIPAEYLEAAA